VHLKVVEEVLTRLGSCNLKMERSGWRDPWKRSRVLHRWTNSGEAKTQTPWFDGMGFRKCLHHTRGCRGLHTRHVRVRRWISSELVRDRFPRNQEVDTVIKQALALLMYIPVRKQESPGLEEGSG
jgi:hypothetical protein